MAQNDVLQSVFSIDSHIFGSLKKEIKMKILIAVIIKFWRFFGQQYRLGTPGGKQVLALIVSPYLIGRETVA